MAVYCLQDLVWLGLSPEWQHSMNEWRTTKHPVDSDWISHNLFSTMGWQRPDMTVFIKTLTGKTFNLRVHPTWTVGGIESILEVLHGFPAAGDQRMIFAGRQLVPGAIVSESQVSDGSMVHIVLKLLGD